MLYTGARLAEIVPSTKGSSHTALLKTEVDLDAGTVSIRTAKGRLGAKGKTRVLSIPADLIEPLRQQVAFTPGPHVFGPLHNSPRDFDLILAAAGIAKVDELGRKVTAHSFRHTYATLMSEAIGHNAFVLKELLGHRQISMTKRYCHPTAPALILPLNEITPFSSPEELGVGKGCKILEISRAAEA